VANVVILSPLYTYATQAGSAEPVPFVCSGVTDVPGQIVVLSEDTTGAELGRTSASNTALPSGAYAGWYPWATTISTWSPTNSLGAPAAGLTASAGGVGCSAVVGLAAGSGAMATGPVSYFAGLGMGAAALTAGAGGVGCAGLVGMAAGAGTAGAGGISISAAADATAPVVTAFTVGTPSGSSVPITAFTATDAVGVTGYLVTESSTPPAAGAAGWTGSAPSTYTAVGTGSVTLYPWAKDAAGNVSSVFGSPRTVTITGGASLTSDFEADANGWTFSNGAARSNTSPIAGSYSVRKTGSGAFDAEVAAKTVSGNRQNITSITIKYRLSQGQPTTGHQLSIYCGPAQPLFDGLNHIKTLVADDVVHELTFSGAVNPGVTGSGAVRLQAKVQDYDDGEPWYTPFTLTIDDVVINGISS
jgi:hypothetical protein